ncbi:hypothetical protein PG994_003031 [Apiospora phragmitis]|uniref:Uncharacterized protein n=1 Tax=Apiospora phragmitis TaxID=2905665 RepID=A0ABR1W6X2_9PEZI
MSHYDFGRWIAQERHAYWELPFGAIPSPHTPCNCNVAHTAQFFLRESSSRKRTSWMTRLPASGSTASSRAPMSRVGCGCIPPPLLQLRRQPRARAPHLDDAVTAAIEAFQAHHLNHQHPNPPPLLQS